MSSVYGKINSVLMIVLTVCIYRNKLTDQWRIVPEKWNYSSRLASGNPKCILDHVLSHSSPMSSLRQCFPRGLLPSGFADQHVYISDFPRRACVYRNFLDLNTTVWGEEMKSLSFSFSWSILFLIRLNLCACTEMLGCAPKWIMYRQKEVCEVCIFTFLTQSSKLTARHWTTSTDPVETGTYPTVLYGLFLSFRRQKYAFSQVVTSLSSASLASRRLFPLPK
jgi:hypothetical protein